MTKQSNTRKWFGAAALAALAVTAVPAQAHTDVAIGLNLGAPAYYAPAPRYYAAPRVVYEEPVYYRAEPEVVYGPRYCPPPRRVYYRPYPHAHGYVRYDHYDRYYRPY